MGRPNRAAETPGEMEWCAPWDYKPPATPAIARGTKEKVPDTFSVSQSPEAPKKRFLTPFPSTPSELDAAFPSKADGVNRNVKVDLSDPLHVATGGCPSEAEMVVQQWLGVCDWNGPDDPRKAIESEGHENIVVRLAVMNPVDPDVIFIEWEVFPCGNIEVDVQRGIVNLSKCIARKMCGHVPI